MSVTEAWAAAFPSGMWVLLAVSAVLCAVGFYKFVYFLSIGYGFAVAGLGISMLIIFRGQYGAAITIVCALLIAYGARLSGFLLVREMKSVSYRKTLSQATGEKEKPMPVFVKFAIWVCVALLYVGQVSPVYYRLTAGAGSGDGCCFAGAALMLIGLCLETVADLQKSAQKKSRPDMVATKGLYKIVRCPNYLGEIIFWTGVLVTGLTTLRGAFQWIIAVVSYICIVYVMLNGAQRLERRQMKRYGNDPEYIAYSSGTPIILPIIPLYHLEKQEKKK